MAQNGTTPHPMARDASNPNPFTGEFRHGIDPKNRITIPADWRSGEGEQLFVRLDSTGSCIIALRPEEFRKVLADAEALLPSPRERQQFVRQFSAASQVCNADKQGRMVLPPEFCSKVGFKGEVVLVGVNGRFEIWNPARWEATKAAESTIYQNLASQLGL